MNRGVYECILYFVDKTQRVHGKSERLENEITTIRMRMRITTMARLALCCVSEATENEIKEKTEYESERASEGKQTEVKETE